MFKNIFLASVIASVLIVGASQPVQALTTSEIQAQIQALLEKVAELTRQLNVLQGQGSTASPSTSVASSPAFPAPRICMLSIRQLAAGARGDDVRAFQEFLQSENVFDAAPTGYFGSVTRAALVRWQEQNGMEGAGVVGPKTLERVRAKCGFGTEGVMRFSASPTRGEAPLTVAFSTWISGFRVPNIYYTIDFGDGTSERAQDCNAPADACISAGINSHTYTANGTYTATLNKVTDPCAGNLACRAAIHSEIVGKTQISVGTASCTKEYMPVCGAKPIVCITTPCNPIPTTYGNRCMMGADGASYLYDGACRSVTPNPADDPQCKAWYDGCNSCSRSGPGQSAMCTLRACSAESMTKPYCTAFFDNVTNQPPTISGLSGPTTLSVSASGTWTVAASDPENGPLSYAVDWGETSTSLNSAVRPSSAAFQQTTSFSHSYSKAGTYTVSVVVTDSVGQATKAATTVKVGEPLVACTMQYDPVCGRPAGCANTCAPGQICPAICQLHTPQTYGNRCMHDAAGAQFIHTGQCTSTSGNWY